MPALARLLGIAIAATLGLGANPACAGSLQQIAASREPRIVTIKQDGVVIKAAVPSEFGDDEADAKFTIAIGNRKPFVLARDRARVASYGFDVAIGKLTRRDAEPTILIAGYTGGAHCCGTLQIVSLIRERVVIDSLPIEDGADLDKFPTDIDGDGTADIEWEDGSLLYEFGSYASSWHVPRFYNVRAGHPINVSWRPGFVDVFRNLTKEALKTCRTGKYESAGACAAYAYGMAVLGRPEEGIRTATSFAEKSYSLITSHFERDLRKLMKENGYLPPFDR